MVIELIIFTENNQVIEIGNEDNVEDIIANLLIRFDKELDEFENHVKMAEFLKDKGINFKIVDLKLN